MEELEHFSWYCLDGLEPCFIPFVYRPKQEARPIPRTGFLAHSKLQLLGAAAESQASHTEKHEQTRSRFGDSRP